MSLSFRTRAKARALIGVALAGVCLCVGVGVGGVYVLGGQAHAAAGGAFAQVMPGKGGQAAVPAPLASATPAPRQVAPIPAPIAVAPVRVARAPDSPRALDCLAAAVYYEARGESADGQAAVAQVVLNRSRAPHFPRDVCAVVYQGVGGHGCQFSFACNGATRQPRELAAWDRARDVAARALGGYVMAAVGGATCFHAARLGGESRAVRLGGHVFYDGTPHRWASREREPVQVAQADSDRPRMTFSLGVLTQVAAAAQSASHVSLAASTTASLTGAPASTAS